LGGGTRRTSASDNKSLTLSYRAAGEVVAPGVVYSKQGSQLVRTVTGSAPSVTVVAGHVADFSAYPCETDGTVSGTGTYARIVLTLASDTDDPTAERKGNFAATYVLIAVPPP
jgi:hypothetical protein